MDDMKTLIDEKYDDLKIETMRIPMADDLKDSSGLLFLINGEV